MSAREDLDGLRDRLALVFEGMTNRQLQRQLGVQTPPWRWVTGQHAPTALTLMKIVRAFGLRADWLLFGRGPMRLRDTEPDQEGEKA